MASFQSGVKNSFYGVAPSQAPSTTTVLARVDRVILGPVQPNGLVDPDFEANGKWNSVGAIRFTLIQESNSKGKNTSTSKKEPPPVAKPLNSALRHFPTVGEIVRLVPGPSPRMNEDGSARDLYYEMPFNLWNNSHHNTFPSLIDYAKAVAVNTMTYNSAVAGAIVSTGVLNKNNYKLGETFVEKDNIRDLQPFEGDTVVQGRWGHSIRFGSTVKDSSIKNPWSSEGSSGDPIIVIRNGQGKQDTSFIGPIDPYIPTVEDINTDGASIYLCSGQAIIIQDLAAFKLDSFTSNTKPTEDQIERPNRTPSSADFVSPNRQSQTELAGRALVNRGDIG